MAVPEITWSEPELERLRSENHELREANRRLAHKVLELEQGELDRWATCSVVDPKQERR